MSEKEIRNLLVIAHARQRIVGFPFVTADEALLRKMKGHSIVLRLKDLAFE